MTYSEETYVKPTYRTDAQVAYATVKGIVLFVGIAALLSLALTGFLTLGR